MSPIIVHGVPGSPYVRMPLLACEEKGAPYRLAAMPFGTTKTPEHLARHPFGRIPVIEHDGFWLYESDAIIRYIDQVFPGPSLTPTDPKVQARMNQVMGIVDCYVHRRCWHRFQPHRRADVRSAGGRRDGCKDVSRPPCAFAPSRNCWAIRST